MNRNQEIVADFEQLETETVQTEHMIRGYYKELIREMPYELVEKLVVDFAHQWWTGSLGLNEQHVFMHNDLEDGEE